MIVFSDSSFLMFNNHIYFIFFHVLFPTTVNLSALVVRLFLSFQKHDIQNSIMFSTDLNLIITSFDLDITSLT